MKRSLEKHPFTVMTLFVNPMQVSPALNLDPELGSMSDAEEEGAAVGRGNGNN